MPFARQASAPGRGARDLAAALAGRTRLAIGSLLLITTALSYPLVFWVPDETASQSPVTEITKTQELIAERFADPVFDYLILVEATGGDVLDKEPLMDLLENSAALRADAQLSKYLVTVDNPRLGIAVHGVWTIADSVDQLLRGLGVGGGLAAATEQQVDEAVTALLSASDPGDWGLAVQTSRDGAGIWHSPALFTAVAADNEKLGGGGFLVTIGTDSLDKEYLARDITEALRGDSRALNVWSPASDVNLTSNEQGELAGPFIGITIAAVLLIVGVSFRSYWAVAISGAALGMLMVWLRGGANLAGLKSDQILSTILPISIVSFGIDSVFHAVGRIREQQRNGEHGRTAFVLGVSSVLAALALAATSDVAAFLSNTAAGIESIIQFGFAAAISTVAAFALLGIATPLVLAVVEERIGHKTVTGLGVGADLVLAVLAAAFAAATVLVLVFVSSELGLLLLIAYVLVALALPYALARRGRGKDAIPFGERVGSPRLGAAVAAVAGHPWLTVAIAGLATAAAMWAGLRLDVTFDVKDFFSSDSDFVVALDKTARYLGDRGGEPALVYVEADLADPAIVEALRTFTDRVAGTGDNPLAVDSAGKVRVDAGVLDLIAASGTDVTNERELSHLYSDALERGLTDISGNPLYTVNDVGTMLWQAGDESTYATVLTYQVPDTRNQVNVTRSREVLEPAADDLEAALDAVDPGARVVVTGSAVYRDDQLAAIRRALLLALPIAVIACFVVAAAFMRSIRYALVSVIPILLVVAWLYGIMYVAGFSINVVTAIIGAVSVGIGIDFSTHYTMRFLEERDRGLPKHGALAAAGAGTGAALFGSALTSVAGFGVLALAPMPMFASYGLLTAIMIVLALVASLFVLPSLLSLVTRDRAERKLATPRRGDAPVRIGVARDVSDVVVAHLRAAFDREVRNATVTVGSYGQDVVPGLVASGEIDIGLVARWPNADRRRQQAGPVLAREELVVVGRGQNSGAGVSLDDLAHGLFVAADAEAEARSLLETEASVPVLVSDVRDVPTGLRLAALTGGAMVLPRTAVPERGALTVRSLDPVLWVEMLVVVAPGRESDPVLYGLIVRLARSLASDGRFELDESVRRELDG